MRTVSASLFASVDGVLENPGGWQFDQFDDGLGELMMTELPKSDTVILGRQMYDEWSAYWPSAEDDFKDYINPIKKYVASTSLSAPLEWENSELIEGDLVDFVRELKQQQGGDINVAGSLSVVRQLLLAGVLDRITLMIHPVLVGEGKRLTEEITPVTRLTLIDHKVTEKGNALMTYALKADA